MGGYKDGIKYSESIGLKHVDQEWDLSIQMTDRYTLGPLGGMSSD